MSTLAIISFYASLVFGLGFGIIAILQIGRVGKTQFVSWLIKMPRSKASSKDNLELLLSSVGVPTSITDVAASVANLGGLKSFFDFFSYFRQNLGSTFSYYASIFGRTLAKLWFFLGIPAFILSIVLRLEGHEYWPKWLNTVGIKTTPQFAITIFSIYIVAYISGRIIGSPQRAFNKARLLYEDVVAREGYWFDNISSRKSFSDRKKSIKLLGKANTIYEKILQKIRNNSGLNSLSGQQLMVLHYQRALLYCTLHQFDDAQKEIRDSIRLKEILKSVSFWDNNENAIFDSQLLFLEGEITLMKGRKNDAKEKFKKSLMIDESLSDVEGVSKNKERLEYISNTA